MHNACSSTKLNPDLTAVGTLVVVAVPHERQVQAA